MARPMRLLIRGDRLLFALRLLQHIDQWCRRARESSTIILDSPLSGTFVNDTVMAVLHGGDINLTLLAEGARGVGYPLSTAYLPEWDGVRILLESTSKEDVRRMKFNAGPLFTTDLTTIRQRIERLKLVRAIAAGKITEEMLKEPTAATVTT